MCKTCGQNLRDQRAQRLAGAHAGELPTEKVSRSRIIAGVLSAIGLLVVVVAAISIDNIEAGLVSVMSEEPVTDASQDFWNGPSASIYDELSTELRDYPTPVRDAQAALDDPVSEVTYNGRYILIEPGALDAKRITGEAALRRRGNRVNFVAILPRAGTEIRGYAVIEDIPLENSEETVERPVVRNTAMSLNVDGVELRGYGLSEPLESGGHRVTAFTSSDDAEASEKQFEIFAFRIR